MQGRSSGLQMCTRVCLHSLGPAGSYGAPVGPPCWQCGLSYAWRKLKPGGRSRWLTTRAQEETFSSIYPVAKTIMQKDKASRRLPGCSGFQCALLLIAARLSSPPPSPFRWVLLTTDTPEYSLCRVFTVSKLTFWTISRKQTVRRSKLGIVWLIQRSEIRIFHVFLNRGNWSMIV